MPVIWEYRNIGFCDTNTKASTPNNVKQLKARQVCTYEQIRPSVLGTSLHKTPTIYLYPGQNICTAATGADVVKRSTFTMRIPRSAYESTNRSNAAADCVHVSLCWRKIKELSFATEMILISHSLHSPPPHHFHKLDDSQGDQKHLVLQTDTGVIYYFIKCVFFSASSRKS